MEVIKKDETQCAFTVCSFLLVLVLGDSFITRKLSYLCKLFSHNSILGGLILTLELMLWNFERMLWTKFAGERHLAEYRCLTMIYEFGDQLCQWFEMPVSYLWMLREWKDLQTLDGEVLGFQACWYAVDGLLLV